MKTQRIERNKQNQMSSSRCRSHIRCLISAFSTRQLFFATTTKKKCQKQYSIKSDNADERTAIINNYIDMKDYIILYIFFSCSLILFFFLRSLVLIDVLRLVPIWFVSESRHKLTLTQILLIMCSRNNSHDANADDGDDGYADNSDHAPWHTQWHLVM